MVGFIKNVFLFERCCIMREIFVDVVVMVIGLKLERIFLFFDWGELLIIYFGVC